MSAVHLTPAASKPPALRVSSLRKTYPARSVPALDGVSFAAAAGDFLALMGTSGSGKSTLLNLIGLLDTPDMGHIELNGGSLDGCSDAELTRVRREQIGFVFQQFHLIPTLSAVENVITPMVADRRARDRSNRARAALAAVGLEDKALRLPGQLSGGEQQRVAIARALVMNPRLVLADEPTGNLDAGTANQILDLIATLRTERGVTVILATHDPLVALRADRVLGLVDGKLTHDLNTADVATPQELLAVLR